MTEQSRASDPETETEDRTVETDPESDDQAGGPTAETGPTDSEPPETPDDEGSTPGSDDSLPGEDATDPGSERPGEDATEPGSGRPGEDATEPGSGRPGEDGPSPGVPNDVRSYDRFQKIEGGEYDRVNDFLRERTYITAREWAIARLCADFRTETGVEMTKIGENLPRLVPFMTDTYSPQAVNQARAAFEDKIRMAGATFLYGAMSGFFTAEELDDMMYETTEVAKFLLEVEGVDLTVEEELDAEDRISTAMREVRQASTEVRHGGTECPSCGHELDGGGENDD